MTHDGKDQDFRGKIRELEEEIRSRKAADERLRKNEERYRDIIEHQLELICRYRHDGTLTFVNEAYCRFFSRCREELVGRDFRILIPEEDRQKIADLMARLGKDSPVLVHEHRVLMPDGRIGWHQWTNTAVLDESGNVIEYQGVGQDITSRKEAEEALRASEEKYRSVVDNIGIGVALISPRMEILTLNKQMKKWVPRIDPEARPICYQAFNDPPRQGICSYCPTVKTLLDGEVHESITETPAGSEIRNYRIISSPVRDGSGNVIAAIEMVEDITERLHAQEAVRASEAKYRTIFETTGAATMLVEEDMSISMVNTEFEQQSGYSKAEVQGKMKWTDFIAEDEETLRKMIGYHNLRRVDPEKVPRNYEFRFRDRGGRVRDVFMTVAIIPGTRMSVASLLDITERKKAEEELQAREAELEIKSRNLEELNTALKVLLKHREDDKSELEERILSNMKELVLPYLEKLKKTPLRGDQAAFANIIESNLSDIISPFLRKMTSKYLNLTPREIQIATLIREGKTTKEISEVLGVSPRAVEFHRDNIRIKLDIKNKKANLRSFLLSLS